MISATGEGTTFLPLHPHPHSPRNSRTTTTYLPKPRDGVPPSLSSSRPNSPRGGWVSQLFQYRDPPSASYRPVDREEELAPLHRLHGDDDDEEEEEGLEELNEEFEVVGRDRDDG
jgi:hypothetical protein